MSAACFSAEELAFATGGKWSSDTSTLPPAMEISTDTRIDGRGKIFFALAGESFDAHDFLDKAAASGCCALCIRKDFTGFRPELPCLEVDDVLRAYQQTAKFHRNRFPKLKVAAVTGSVGKTSTKEMVRAILTGYTGNPDAVLYTIGNTNNHVGVPQNLLRLNDNHRYAVIEMGTSSPGEISPLSAMARPDVAGVNTVAACHLEKLIDLDGVAFEKGTVYSGLERGGVAVMGENVHGREILARAAGNHRILIFGTDATVCDVAVNYLHGDLAGSEFELIFPRSGKRFTVKWALSGAHQALNAACASASALALGVPEEAIASGLTLTTLPGQRMKQTVVDNVVYVNDAYNANPASMRALLKLIKSGVAPEKLILCLGGMRELGENSRNEHIELLNIVASEFSACRLITIGPEFDGIAGNGKFFLNSTDAAAYLAAIVRSGDTVVAKGSNGNRVYLALPEAAQ